MIDKIGHWNWMEPEPLLKALIAVVEYTRPNDWDFTDEKYNKIETFKIIERHLK
jgi:hypothetical protein